MIKLPDLSALKALVKRTLRPRTKWGRVTLWSGGLSVLLYALGWLTGSRSSAKPGGWTVFFALIFAFCALRLVARWAWRRVMWRLRYRLIVTYVFIGVIPIVLLLLMAAWAASCLPGNLLRMLRSRICSRSCNIWKRRMMPWRCNWALWPAPESQRSSLPPDSPRFPLKDFPGAPLPCGTETRVSRSPEARS